MEFDPNLNKRREAVLNRAPLLRAVLNYESTDIENILEVGAPMIHEISDRFGKNWHKLVIPPLYFSGTAIDVFNPKVEIENTIRSIIILVQVGYEVGNKEDLHIFEEDISKFLIKSGIANSEVNNYNNLLSITKSIIYTGSYLKSGGLQVGNEDKSNIPKPFGDFIKGFDLNDL
ncbi:MAG: hypothetical protein Q8P80_02515 [Candidatus Levybacteria bacterium]|nr:hypothetical protein [Candidatus Levybacteria bacterium]